MAQQFPAVGDKVHLGHYLVGTDVYGVILPPDSPDAGFAATFEIQGDQGTLMLPALRGPKGDPGQPQFALRLQKSLIDEPSELPDSLTNTDADLGKYWMIDDVDGEGNVIGSSAYIWFGTAFRRMAMGTPGPVGPVPVITPSVELLDPDNPLLQDEIVVTGGTFQPNWHLKLKVPRGPEGPSATIESAPDVDISTPPLPGSVLGHLGRMTPGGQAIWEPVTIGELIPAPYSMPEAAFSSFSGLSQRATIGTFPLPAQGFPWTPLIWGHITASGIELDPDPLTIGAEVRLGDPVTGRLIARGFGNAIGQVTLIPHYSTPAQPNIGITPENGLAVVPANHSNPAQGTIYVNLYNDGIAGVYQFNPENAQVFILVQPIAG